MGYFSPNINMNNKISGEHLANCVAKILKYSTETKKRNFVETVELQIGLKAIDPRKDKRFKGSIVLPSECRRKMKVCVLGNVQHCEEAEALGLDSIGLDELKGFKRLASQYDAFLASDNLIKQIPRLLGPGLNKAGKFPGVVTNADSLEAKVREVRSTVKFQLKKVMCIATAVGDVSLTQDQIEENVANAIIFLISLLK